MYNYFDVHSHLNDKAFDEDRDSLIAEMKSTNVGTIVVGTDVHESTQAVALADRESNFFATVGLHPADNVLEEFNKNTFLELAQNKKVVAIGECGLDYFYIEKFFERDQKEKGITHNKDAEADRQKIIFEDQIMLAVQVNKPLMLHGRPSTKTMDAYEDMLYILERAKNIYGDKLRGNAHFFVGNIDIAKRFLAIGFTMSFSGVITFTHDYDEVLRFLPLDMIHAETDSPYATPAPNRGKRNSPLYVKYIYEKIAEIKGLEKETVRLQLLENAKRVFGG